MRVACLLAVLFVLTLVSANFDAKQYWEKIKAKTNEVKNTGSSFIGSMKYTA